MAATIDFTDPTVAHSGQLVTTAQAVSAASTYDLVGTLTTYAPRVVTISGVVAGTGPLTGFKITRTAKVGGTHKDYLVDTDLNTPTSILKFATSNIYTLATGSTFQITLDLAGAHEYKFYGKAGNATTIQMDVSY